MGLLAQGVAPEVAFPHVWSLWAGVLHTDSERCRPQLQKLLDAEASPSTYCVSWLCGLKEVSAGSWFVCFRLTSL